MGYFYCNTIINVKKVMKNNNYSNVWVVLLLAVVMAFPSGVCAREFTVAESQTVETVPDFKWYSNLWGHLQFAANMGINMYGDNVINSCINHLGHDDGAYSQLGMKGSFEVMYNIYERKKMNFCAGMGFAFYCQNFKKNYIYFVDEGSIATFMNTNNADIIANMDSKQPADFDYDDADWNSSYSVFYVTFPVSVSYSAGKIEYSATLLPAVRLGRTSLRRNISACHGVDDVENVLYTNADRRLDGHINRFACNLRLSCIYCGFGGFVEFGTVSMTKGLKYDTYSFSIGMQLRIATKNFGKTNEQNNITNY